jgi:hypothetical protein
MFHFHIHKFAFPKPSFSMQPFPTQSTQDSADCSEMDMFRGTPSHDNVLNRHEFDAETNDGTYDQGSLPDIFFEDINDSVKYCKKSQLDKVLFLDEDDSVDQDVPFSLIGLVITCATPKAKPRNAPPPDNIPHDDLRKTVTEAMEWLPQELKAAYLEAADKCPQMITSESDPYLFLQQSNWDCTQAATLLATNWKIRLELFGEERAFLPLSDLSGQGSLTEEDIKVLASGFIVFLPSDAQRRTVLFVNAQRHGRRNDILPFRCFFYMWMLASKRGLPVSVIRYATDGIMLNKAKSDQLELILLSFPFEIGGLYILHMLPPESIRRHVTDVQIPMLMRNLEQDISKVTQNAVCKTPQQTLQQLLKLGFDKDALPDCVGGTWSYDVFHSWLDSRRKVFLEFD